MTSPTAQFGFDPITRPLVLSRGADFIQRLVPAAGSFFPSGTEVWIALLSHADAVIATWNAAVTSSEAAFHVQADAVDPIPDDIHYRLYVRYPTVPTSEYLWYRGPVRRKQ